MGLARQTMKSFKIFIEEELRIGTSMFEKDLRKATETINKRIEAMEEAGEDDPDNHEFAALSHISTALELRLNSPLSHRANLRTSFVVDNNQIIAAGSMWIPRKATQAEITNVGSITRGAGQQVVKSLEDQARAKGVTRIILTSTARSFYERLGYRMASSGKMEKNIT